MTPQEALRMQMQSLVSKVEKDTGVAFPKFYNPAAVNPAKLAEITKKRKMLWSGSGASEKEARVLSLYILSFYMLRFYLMLNSIYLPECRR